MLGGRIRVGALRSPLRDPEQLAALARAVERRPGFRLVGLMGYEGHVAGVGDAVPGRPLRSRAIRLMQSAARRELAARRAAAVRAVRAVGGPRVRQRRRHGQRAAHRRRGRGDGDRRRVRALPAAAVRQLHVLPRAARPPSSPSRWCAGPGVGVVTVLGGGYPASGAAGPDRLPVPYLPEGLRYDPQEGPARCRPRCWARPPTIC